MRGSGIAGARVVVARVFLHAAPLDSARIKLCPGGPTDLFHLAGIVPVADNTHDPLVQVDLGGFYWPDSSSSFLLINYVPPRRLVEISAPSSSPSFRRGNIDLISDSSDELFPFTSLRYRLIVQTLPSITWFLIFPRRMSDDFTFSISTGTRRIRGGEGSEATEEHTTTFFLFFFLNLNSIF